MFLPETVDGESQIAVHRFPQRAFSNGCMVQSEMLLVLATNVWAANSEQWLDVSDDDAFQLYFLWKDLISPLSWITIGEKVLQRKSRC